MDVSHIFLWWLPIIQQFWQFIFNFFQLLLLLLCVYVFFCIFVNSVFVRVYRFVRYTQKKNGKKRKCESETVEKIWDQNIPREEPTRQNRQTDKQIKPKIKNWLGMWEWGTNGRWRCPYPAIQSTVITSNVQSCIQLLLYTIQSLQRQAIKRFRTNARRRSRRIVCSSPTLWVEKGCSNDCRLVEFPLKQKLF